MAAPKIVCSPRMADTAAAVERIQEQLRAPDPRLRRRAEKTALFAARYGRALDRSDLRH